MKTAYPQVLGTCTITLYVNIPFDNTYQHHSLVSSLFTYKNSAVYTGTDSQGIAKERFINRQRLVTGYPYYYPRWTLTGDYNFNFSNGLVGSITLELTPEQTNANYMKLKCGNDIYYYFITGISQNNFGTYTLSLELDALMTYQDEFITGMKDIPVFTNRKQCHRWTNDGLMPLCADFKTGEETFAGVKPSIIENKINLDYNNSKIKNIKDIVWLYICADSGEDYGLMTYKNKGISYPLSMLVLPLNLEHYTIADASNNILLDVDKDDINECISKYLIGQGNMYGAKISNYPPFTDAVATTYNSNTNSLILKVNDTGQVVSGIPNLKIVKAGNNSFVCATSGTGLSGNYFMAMVRGALAIIEQEDVEYAYSGVKLVSANANAPTILSDRYSEPKLLFAPFKKYVLTAKYSSEGVELYPELLYSGAVTTSSVSPFVFSTIATGYIGDNNIFTYLHTYEYYDLDLSHYVMYENYKYQKIGLAGAVNYIMPVGTDALQVFNATQSQSFYTSKVASGISSGLSIAGGVASIALGSAGMALGASNGGLSTIAGYGLVASGATAIAGGVAGGANAIKSTTAKIEDLKNTPDSINISGSNFITDTAIIDNTTPYIIVYGIMPAVKEQANDFFYNYGYFVARECYFNTELYYDATTNKVDNNIFGRTIFNYVKINEDITNKINADIPHIIKQKLSKIFNDGITLWNFYGFVDVWGTGSVATDVNYYIDKWFMKCTLDNTELSIMAG